jgi:hypothetical protein
VANSAGQAARLATNYDGLVISVLAEAQADGAPERRTAGRCPLRGLRKADVAVGDCARLAATVSLVLAAASATAAAFAHTAVLAARPANAGPLREAGRLFGRIAHLVDSVEDLAADQAAGAWNPLLATGADLAEARRLCDDALLGIKLALDEVEFTDARLVHALLVHELTRSVHRVFGRAGGAAAPRAQGCEHGHASAPLAGCGLPVAGLAGLAGLGGLGGLFSVRHRCGRCCPDCCCEGCMDGCIEGCCDACCSNCDCNC